MTRPGRYLVPVFLAVLVIVLIAMLSVTFTQTTRINLYLTDVARFERTYLESDLALQGMLVEPDLLGQYRTMTQSLDEAMGILAGFEDDAYFQSILDQLPGMDDVFAGILQMRDQLLTIYLEPLTDLFVGLDQNSDIVRGAFGSNLRNWLNSRIAVGAFSLHAFQIINRIDILLDFKPRFFNLFTELSTALNDYLTDLLFDTSVITVVVISVISALAIFIVFYQIRQRHHYTMELERTVEDRTAQLISVQDRLVESEKFASMQKISRGLAHEFNTPLGNIITASSHLNSLLGTLENQTGSGTLTVKNLESFIDQSNSALAIISHEVHRSADILSILRDIQPETDDSATGEVDLRLICAEIREALPPELAGKPFDVELNPGDCVRFVGYPFLVRQVIKMLVTNSTEHAQPAGDKLRIEVACAWDEETVEIRVSDNGQGIPQSEIENIFEPFSRLRKNKSYYGLGLFTVYTIVTARMGGTISAEVPPGGGISFVIRLPRPELGI